MKKIILPAIAALALGGAVAGELVFSSAIAQPSPASSDANAPKIIAQANPGPTPMPGERMRRAGPGASQDGGMDMHARLAQICDGRYARAVGAMAYLQTRLVLTSAQQPLFDRWKNVRLGAAKTRQNACTTATPAPGRATPLERMTREEDMLKHRIADLDAERPALAALYAALTPEQQHTFQRGAGMAGMAMRPGMRRHGMMGPRAAVGHRPRGFGIGAVPAPPPPG